MSAYLLGLGFRADMGTCVRKLVLLKLIDACEDDGSRIFPAVATVARAAQCSARQVQRELKGFLDIGLIELVREGGRGRRSTNEYAMDLAVLAEIGRVGWDAFVAARGEPKGDTVSPLEGEVKGDTGGADRVTRETAKGDIACHPTPPDPSPDPSIERERAGERETNPVLTPQAPDGAPGDRRAAVAASADAVEAEAAERPEGSTKRAEALFFRAFKGWDRFDVSPKQPMLAAWGKLSWSQMEAAADAVPRFLAANRAAGVRQACAISTYLDLAERMWERFPAGPEQKPETEIAPPFGPLWQAARLAQLLAGPAAALPALTMFERQMVASGAADEAGLQREKRRKFGWPALNRMHELAERGKGVPVAAALARLEALMERVPVGSERYRQWEAEHALRGWPWLPDPGRQPVVYFPAGGPGGLAEFEKAVRSAAGGEPDRATGAPASGASDAARRNEGNRHDGDRCEAAE